jgi:hypothetical protein
MKGVIAEATFSSLENIAGIMLNKHNTVINRLPSLLMVRYFTRGESCILFSTNRLRVPFTLLPFFYWFFSFDADKTLPLTPSFIHLNSLKIF